MLKIIISFLLMLNILNSNELKNVNDLNDLKQQDIFLVQFSKNNCSWCKYQDNVMLNIKKTFTNVSVIKIKKENKQIFNKMQSLLKIGIKYYPTTVLVKKEGSSYNVMYEFYGFQKYQAISEILNDKEIMDF